MLKHWIVPVFLFLLVLFTRPWQAEQRRAPLAEAQRLDLSGMAGRAAATPLSATASPTETAQPASPVPPTSTATSTSTPTVPPTSTPVPSPTQTPLPPPTPVPP